ncbi:MAG: type II toxin-antitoxin system HicB family antitoxin [Synergistaceae bacterium]|jgi:predicted RNase H-like HicB family nuclease|nr:type II toxin-antitoxin system HicB family antitoxin [Synergistaceae bacterium]
MKLTYPAIFYPWEKGNGYTVEVPDLPGCVTEGDTLAEAILMGIDAASGWVLSELEEGKQVPEASEAKDIRPERDGFVNVLALDMDSYTEKYGGKAIRKNLTIPAWLNTFGEEHDLNFSKVLQDALSKIFEKYNEIDGNYQLNEKTVEKIFSAAEISEEEYLNTD